MPRESHGQRSLGGYSPQGRKESDTTEATQHSSTHVWNQDATCLKAQPKKKKRRSSAEEWGVRTKWKLKATLFEMKNALEELNSRLDITTEKVRDFQDRSV